MAANQSQYTIHVTDEDGNPVAVGPGEDIPAHVDVDNPYVTGKAKDKVSPDPEPRRTTRK